MKVRHTFFELTSFCTVCFELFNLNYRHLSVNTWLYGEEVKSLVRELETLQKGTPYLN